MNAGVVGAGGATWNSTTPLAETMRMVVIMLTITAFRVGDALGQSLQATMLLLRLARACERRCFCLRGARRAAAGAGGKDDGILKTEGVLFNNGLNGSS